MEADSKDSGECAHLQGLPEHSFLDTAMSTSTKSNVMAYLIYFLLLVYNLFSLISNIQRINRIHIHKNDHFPMRYA